VKISQWNGLRVATYDVETYPNYFCCAVKLIDVPSVGLFECSHRRDDSVALAQFFLSLARAVGFNNAHFDYVIMHHLCSMVESGEAALIGGRGIAVRLYDLASEIIAATPGEAKAWQVWPRHRRVTQVDLMAIHHLNNRARATGLKALQIWMRSPSVEDLPYPPGSWLSDDQMNTTGRYCCHDVTETERLLMEHSLEAVAFRENIGEHALTMSDASLGKSHLRRILERHEPGCTARATVRTHVEIADIIVPGVSFQTPQFREVLDKYTGTFLTVASMRKTFPTVKARLGDLTYYYGLGGLHASVKREHIRETTEYEIVDIDVESDYPTFAIQNRLRPAHLGDTFVDAYAGLFADRKKHAKGSAENKILKLALNAVFGDSGSEHSRGFQDVGFMLAITVNCQLLISMLAEAVSLIPDARIIQANTDGLTVHLPRSRRAHLNAICDWWQAGTRQRLEFANYGVIWIRDVSSYLAVYSETGKQKRKGDYDWQKEMWSDPSALCVPRAAVAALTAGTPCADFITRHLAIDPWDFLLRARARGRDHLEWSGERIQRNSRYYVSTDGGKLLKISPPTAFGVPRQTELQAGRLTRIVNTFDGQAPCDLAIDWYVSEAEKLTRGFKDRTQ
jgi:hypothetical protein